MTKDEFYDSVDFGTTQYETFEQYIIRVGEHIKDYKIRFGIPSSGLQKVIIDIFKTSLLNKVEVKTGQIDSRKYDLIINKLKEELNKELTKELYGKEISK
jgi:hypothetical protein